MPIRSVTAAGAALLAASFATPAHATPFFFGTGGPDGKMATASRPGPGSGVNQETESADDFVTGATLTTLDSATFTGLLPFGSTTADIAQVRVEIYRIFPKDSDTLRTITVPTRANSPSDIAFLDRDSAAASLSFSTTLLAADFTVLNSVDTGIHPLPNQTTGGDGAVSGQEVRFNVTFLTPIDLTADHYFFVPQVLLTDANDHFLWLSAPKPIVTPGTPFAPDLQSWIRNADLDPDWLRVGTDIVGGNPAPTFNAAFSLTGETVGAVPEPAALALFAGGLLGVCLLRRRAAA